MAKSYIIYTNNSEKKIKSILSCFLDMWIDNEDELIIFDDLSEDNTVPIIVSMIGTFFMDEKHFKFYINSKKEGKMKSIEKAKSIASNRCIILGG